MTVTFKDIKADIMARIVSGEWPPDALVPNEVDLAKGYGCARATVNRAMRELAEDGVVERRRKAGTRVRKVPLREARFSIPIVRDEIAALPADYAYTLIGTQISETPDWLTPRLGTGPLLHLLCRHDADGAPYQLEDRWINLAMLPQAEHADFTAVGPNEWLVATVPYSEVEISFSAAVADGDMAAHLGCASGDPVFTVERSTWWKGQAITFARLSFRPGHRITTRY